MPLTEDDPVTQQQRYKSIWDQGNQQTTIAETLSPEIAARVQKIYKDAPYIPANVILSMAKNGTSPAAVNGIKKVAMTQAAKNLEPNKPKDKGWFQEIVYDNVKAASRWSFAGLATLPDLVDNLASQGSYNPNNPAGTDGWFKSTQLGTLMSNTKQAGDGFFLGEKAMKTQAQRAREFRGTIDGEAWSLGRGAAQVAFVPGSIPYSILSGFVDGAVELVADPTLIVGKAAKAVKAGKALIPAISSAEEIGIAAKLATKGLAGLTAAESTTFEATKFSKWALSDPRSKRLISRVVANATDATKSAEEKTLFILENIKGLDVVAAKAFSEADEEAKVLGILGSAAARLATNPADVLLPTDIRDIRLAKAGISGQAARVAEKLGAGQETISWLDESPQRIALYRNIRNSRWFATMPKNSVIFAGTGEEKAQAVKTYANYFRGIKLGDETPEFKNVMQKVVAAYASTDPTTAKASVKEAYDYAFKVIFESVGGTKNPAVAQTVEDILKAARSAKSRVFNLNDTGRIDDDGTLQMLEQYLPDGALDDFDPIVRQRLVISGPGALNELADEVQILPDYRRIRALAGNPWLTRNSTGGQRFGAMGAEFIQNEIWKPLTLATGGYVMRNMLDAQTRMSMSGLGNLFTHPRDYMMWVLRRKGGFDIVGDDFGGVTAEFANKGQKKFWQTLTFDTHKNLKDPFQAEQNLVSTGSFAIANRGADPTAHINGYVDNLALINDDEDIMRQIARLSLENLDQPTRTQRIIDWLKLPDNKETYDQFRNYLSEGVKISDPVTGDASRIMIKQENLDDAMAVWLERLSELKVNVIVKNNEELKVVAAYNKMPLIQTLADGRVVTVAPINLSPNSFDPEDIILGDGGIGSIIIMPDGNEGVVIREMSVAGGIDPFTGLPSTNIELVVQPVYAGPAFTKDGLGSQNLRDLLDSLGREGKLAEFVKKSERDLLADPKLGNKVLAGKDKLVDFFFVQLYGKATQVLEKSPVFRQYYYREVFAQSDLLSPDEAKNLLARAEVTAKELGIKFDNYMGGKEVRKKLEDIAASNSTAEGTLDQLDDFAKASALRQTKELLYNATERSNIEDIMRVIIPFGAAWKEVLGTYAKAVMEDPTRLRKAQIIFNAGKQFDPENDGQGFFYPDPTTGEYSFNFPMSGAISQLLTGQKVDLQAPVKRLSIGLGVIPSIGPVAQIAASKLIPDTPSADWITSILLPYGKKEGGIKLTPMWMSKAWEAWEADTQNLQTIYGNTYVETLRALSASGEYDLTDINEKDKLFADAKFKARILTGMRALGQFFGPTSPTSEFKIDTIKGDFYGTQLVKEFQKLQTENYDTSVSEFLRIYGNDALLYISNKTEAVAGGLEATDQFGEWERSEGKGLINKYPLVAGFMAPGGDDFSFEVWSRQISKGRRRRLSDREIIEVAQYRAASSKYRALRDQLPAKPSADQKSWLRQWRVQLNKEYPGFPVVAEFNPGEFPKKIEQLTTLISDPKMADNDVAEATRQYLDARSKAIDSYVKAGGAAGGFATATATGPLRNWLAQIGQALKQETPEFARLYERLLSNEVEE